MTRDLGAFQLIPREVAGWILFGGLILALIFWPYTFC